MSGNATFLTGNQERRIHAYAARHNLSTVAVLDMALDALDARDQAAIAELVNAPIPAELLAALRAHREDGKP